MMDRRTLYRFGLIAPVLFLFTAILGGALRPEYSPIADTVSELFSPGSPNRVLLSILYLLFAFSLILYGLGLLKYVQNRNENQRIGRWGAYIFILVGVLNILTATVFPQDSWGSPPTFQGEMHKIVSAIITIFSMFYMLLFGIWFRRSGIGRYFLIYSLATMGGAVLSGAWFVINVGTPLMGFTERVAILVGFQWTVVQSILVIKSDPEPAPLS